MSLSITGIKSGAVQVSVWLSKLYDQMLGSDQIINALAQRVPPKGRQRIQRIAWGEAFPQLREWVGDRVLQNVFGEEITLETKAYEMTYPIDRVDAELDGDAALLQPKDIAAKIMAGYAVGIADLVYDPLRKNQLSYDSQNMFDTDHTHPDGSTGSNVLDLSDASISRSATGNPTMDEAARELRRAMALLQVNRKLRGRIRMVGDVALAVVVKSDGTQYGYHQLLTEDKFPDGRTNALAGKFALMRDDSPESGDEKKVDFIMADPGGVRPSILMEVQRPGPVVVDLQPLARKGAMGNHGLYAIGPGFWQAAVRVQE